MKHRYDFIYLFDCCDANPNGDPDAGNLPRLDTETGQGVVTDVCIKRKIRDYVELNEIARIYVKSRAVLNAQNNEAWEEISPKTPKAKRNDRPKDEGTAEKLRAWMCKNFYDIRTFGAVMTTEVNCGQVRGPAQISFARSVDRIFSQEHAISVCAARKEGKSIDSQIGLQGRKFTVPYALYRTHGTVNPFLAKQTGFTEAGDGSDLETLFQALEHAFDFDASAARPAGSMAPQALLVFRHEKPLGNAPAHKLFEYLQIESFDSKPAADGKPPRKFADYTDRIKFDGEPLIDAGEEKDLGNGVTLIRRI